MEAPGEDPSTPGQTGVWSPEGAAGQRLRAAPVPRCHARAVSTEPLDPTPLTKSSAVVDGKRMAYHEAGEGDPVVFLHGNPTSSYLWRNVIPHLSAEHRCIAPDLIGQGDSDPLDDVGPGSYRFVEHRRYLDGLLDQLDLGDRVTLVVHDWGSALGFDWANRHRDRVVGLAYMEAIVRPVTWDEWPDVARDLFRAFRSDAGEEMVIDQNLFVEAVLPASILRDLTDEEMEEYRRPFREPRASAAHADLASGDPHRGRARRRDRDRPGLRRLAGHLGGPEAVRRRRPRRHPHRAPSVSSAARWPNQTEVTVAGNHFVQEDSPHEIGEALAAWMDGI